MFPQVLDSSIMGVVILVALMASALGGRWGIFGDSDGSLSDDLVEMLPRSTGGGLLLSAYWG
jgi:hypothetical protein